MIKLTEDNIYCHPSDTYQDLRIEIFGKVDKKQLKQQILQNQRIVEKINQKIKDIENNIIGADARLHPEIYKIAMDVLENLKEVMKK